MRCGSSPQFPTNQLNQLSAGFFISGVLMNFNESTEGFKVLEVNNINCAGFYECDIPSIVEAILSL